MLLMVFFVVMLSQAGPRLTGAEELDKEPISAEQPTPPTKSIATDGGRGLLSSDGAAIPIQDADASGENGVLPDQNGVLRDGDGASTAEYTGTKAVLALDPGTIEQARQTDLSVLEMERRLAEAERQRAQLARELMVTLRQLEQTPTIDGEQTQPPQLRSQSDAAVQDPQTGAFAEEWARRVQALEATAATFLEENDLLSQIDLVATPLGVELRLPEEVLFSSGSPELETLGAGLMAKVVPLLMETSSRIKISGHTDDVPIRTSRFPSNWELSAARAIAVVRALRSMGLPEDRLEAVGYGANRPIVPNDTIEGRAKNRRVTIDLSPMPNQLDRSEAAD